MDATCNYMKKGSKETTQMAPSQTTNFYFLPLPLFNKSFQKNFLMCTGKKHKNLTSLMISMPNLGAFFWLSGWRGSTRVFLWRNLTLSRLARMGCAAATTESPKEKPVTSWTADALDQSEPWQRKIENWGNWLMNIPRK